MANSIVAPKRALRWPVIGAFAAVYVIWGSTYLAIRFAIETLPPFMMAGARFLCAGGLLYAYARLHGAPRPAGRHWRTALIVGGLLLLAGNGGVVWAEQRVPSGLAALLVAVVPAWMVLLDWARPGGVRPGRRVALGVALGLAGLVLLVGPGQIAGSGRVDLLGAGVLMLGSLCWAIGSVYSRHAPVPDSPLLFTGMEMLAGGVLLTLAGGAVGNWTHFSPGVVSLRSLLAAGYLVIFGSLIGFTCYVWLLRTVPVHRAATYAYVNPVVAVFLGWALAGEPLTLRTLLAAAVSVTAVVLITTYQQRSR